MRMNPLTLSALLISAIISSGCASWFQRPAPPTEPPRLTLPALAATPCVLPRLPENPTWADLDAVAIQRAAALVQCEVARALAVETLTAERALQDRWRAEHPK